MLFVYVPRPDSDLDDAVWAGSGIVGSPVGTSGRLRVDYEGDQDIYPRYADRVRRAAERHRYNREHRKGYPTRACAFVDPDEVVRVGRYDPEKRRVIVAHPEPLEAWLGVAKLSPEELKAEAQ